MSYAAMLDAYTGPPDLTPPLRVRRKSVAPPDFRRAHSAAPTTPTAPIPVEPKESKKSRPRSAVPAELKKAQRRTLSADSRLPTIFANLTLPPTPVTMSATGSPPKDTLKLPDETDSPERNLDALILELRSSLSSSQSLLHSQAQRLTQLGDLEAELSQLRDQHAFVVAAKEAVENDLRMEKKKREAAEETVNLLRGQVDQARRGVGMLQKQEKDRKRMSQIPHMPPGGFGALMDDPEELLEKEPTSKASKRASFMGRTHRRASSNSEPDVLVGSSRPTPYTSPNPDAPAKSGGLRELRLGSLANPTSGSALVSPIGTHFEEISHPVPPTAITGQRTPSSSTMGATAHVSPPRPFAHEEEAAQLRLELNRIRGQLAESEENRIASEVCLKALRDFMASGGEDAPPPNELLRSMRLPPLPSDPEPGQEMDDQAQKKAGWGFKLWRGAPSPPASTTVEPPRSPEIERESFGATISNTPMVSPLPTSGEPPVEGAVQAVPTSQTPLASFVSGWTKGVVPGTPADRPVPGGRKLTSFFSRGQAKKDEKDLPAAPEGEGEGEGLDPSPEIVDLTEGQESKRSSGSGKDPKDLKDVHGTPKRDSGEANSEVSPKTIEVDESKS